MASTKKPYLIDDLSKPIVRVVAPLKVDAIAHAEKYAKEVLADAKKTLAASGWDLQKVAPYPSGSSFDYMAKVMKYRFYTGITKAAEGSTIRHMDSPDIRVIDYTGCAKFVKEAKENAATQYDLYVVKLVGKIGTVLHATLEGNHIWGFSFLTVELPTGEKQIWKTQSILNQSKYGKIFNQFPTRIVKAKQ